MINDSAAKVFITSKYKADQAAEIVATTLPNVAVRLMLDGTIDGYESYERRRCLVAADAVGRGARRRHRHALLVGHHGPPEGRRPTSSRHRRWRPLRAPCRAVLQMLFGSDQRQRVPVAGALLPRRSAALFDGCAGAGRDGGCDGALRRRAIPGPDRPLSRDSHPGRADDVHPPAQARSRGTRQVRRVVAALRHPRRRAVPCAGEEADDRVVRADPPRVLRGHRGQRLRVLQQRDVAGPPGHRRHTDQLCSAHLRRRRRGTAPRHPRHRVLRGRRHVRVPQRRREDVVVAPPDGAGARSATSATSTTTTSCTSPIARRT